MLVIKEHDVTPGFAFGADMADVDVIACSGSALSAPVPAAPHVDVCVFDLSDDTQRISLDRSVVSQIDGLCYSLLRVRAERDVFAERAESSVCAVFGCPKYLSWGCFTGWFLPKAFDRASISAMVRRAERDRAYGIFVLPMNSSDPWFAACHKACLLTFQFPAECLLPAHAFFLLEYSGNCGQLWIYRPCQVE